MWWNKQYSNNIWPYCYTAKWSTRSKPYFLNINCNDTAGYDLLKEDKALLTDTQRQPRCQPLLTAARHAVESKNVDTRAFSPFISRFFHDDTQTAEHIMPLSQHSSEKDFNFNLDFIWPRREICFCLTVKDIIEKTPTAGKQNVTQVAHRSRHITNNVWHTLTVADMVMDRRIMSTGSIG